jgi:hypothetical protein
MEPYSRKALCGFFFLFTILTIFCECCSYWNLRTNYLEKLIQKYSIGRGANGANSFIAVNCICLIPLGYICASSNYGMFSIKVNSIYEVHGNQTTDPGSLVYSAMLLTKLAVSVAYNFLALSGVDNCAFFVVMGPLDSISWMGASFDRYVFPTCLFLMVFMTVFNIYGRILNCFGLK